MKKPYLILDCNGLCHRAFHTTGELKYSNSFGSKPTGTTYGFLSAVMQLEGQFDSKKFIFCFDKGDSKRMETFPEYKKKRKALQKKWTKQQAKAFAGMYRQIKELRRTILKGMGYKNVFAKEGYEADDIIARVCKSIGRHPAVIVSQDSDMYQLITKRISVYNPRTKVLWTKKKFKKVFGIKPREWVQVKAIAGCGTDEVGGVVGVGELTALKFIRGELKVGSAKWKLITCGDGVKMRCRNIPLVHLPLKGTPDFKIKKDKKVDWKPALKSMGMKKLLARHGKLRGLDD